VPPLALEVGCAASSAQVFHLRTEEPFGGVCAGLENVRSSVSTAASEAELEVCANAGIEQLALPLATKLGIGASDQVDLQPSTEILDCASRGTSIDPELPRRSDGLDLDDGRPTPNASMTVAAIDLCEGGTISETVLPQGGQELQLSCTSSNSRKVQLSNLDHLRTDFSEFVLPSPPHLRAAVAAAIRDAELGPVAEIPSRSPILPQAQNREGGMESEGCRSSGTTGLQVATELGLCNRLDLPRSLAGPACGGSPLDQCSAAASPLERDSKAKCSHDHQSSGAATNSGPVHAREIKLRSLMEMVSNLGNDDPSAGEVDQCHELDRNTCLASCVNSSDESKSNCQGKDEPPRNDRSSKLRSLIEMVSNLGNDDPSAGEVDQRHKLDRIACLGSGVNSNDESKSHCQVKCEPPRNDGSSHSAAPLSSMAWFISAEVEESSGGWEAVDDAVDEGEQIAIEDARVRGNFVALDKRGSISPVPRRCATNRSASPRVRQLPPADRPRWNQSSPRRQSNPVANLTDLSKNTRDNLNRCDGAVQPSDLLKTRLGITSPVRRSDLATTRAVLSGKKLRRASLGAHKPSCCSSVQGRKSAAEWLAVGHASPLEANHKPANALPIQVLARSTSERE
jgi:hypothetical protein